MKFAIAFCVYAAATFSFAADEQKVAAPHAKPPERRVQVPQPTTPVRHLSDVERAELRLQLQQFNRQYKKRP